MYSHDGAGSRGSRQELADVAIDADGKIVAAGYVNSGGPLIVATRYSAAGAIDSSFGGDGVATAPATALQTRMRLLADGRILGCGDSGREIADAHHCRSRVARGPGIKRS